jgi:hypothetical protein
MKNEVLEKERIVSFMIALEKKKVLFIKTKFKNKKDNFIHKKEI